MQRTDVSHHQLEQDLVHLEHILPQLVANSALGMVYWRQRITALETAQSLLPDGARRVTRLLSMINQIDDATRRS
ncbi:hypothetical protein SAMN02787142_2565 [Burkholderia sp. WP9]|jgi:hypothetical protein|uniref:hypothetical protein n=1 Tax=Burkholderiaceae TaxID=119060 RepID=UPI000894280C|nr:hypothetical protein [Burkholderia sp. WP9]SED10511.1 hypothetical protein SAMN02787142_2565 [Burkholderia sp. WP9]